MIPIEWIQEAAGRIAPYVQETELSFDPEYNFYLKWENHQVTGSFKVRGAFNKVLVLEDWEKKAGLITASAGNHGRGVAMAGKIFGIPVTVYASEFAVPVKIKAMRSLEAHVIQVSGGYGEAENAALLQAEKSGATWISPYNDGQVITGQGTIALEILHQLDRFSGFRIQDTTWIVPTGGGGLLSGIGAVLSSLDKRPKLIGVQAENSPFTHAIYHTGSQEHLSESSTLADGLAGPVETNSITIPLIRTYADDFLLVSEDEIRQALCFAWDHYRERLEGAAATALAAALFRKFSGPVVLILSGGNIQQEVHTQITANTYE